MKELDFNLKDNPFINFQSARYTISSRVNVEKLWKYSKNNKKSFFILSLACLINAVNSVPHLKRRIINNKVIEYEYLDGVSPIMDEEHEICREMRIKPPEKFTNIWQWYDYVKNTSNNILKGEDEGFTLKMEERDKTNIANFSCIPWIDFENISSCQTNGKQIQPLITWGKVNKNHEMTVAITVSHIFVNGRELSYFYNNLQDNLNNILW